VQTGQKDVPRTSLTAGSARGPAVTGWTALVIVWVVWGSTYLAIRVGLVGAGLLAGLGRGGLSASGLGVLVILIAAVSWALGTIFAGRLTLPSGPLLATAMQMLTGGTAIMIVAAVALVVRRQPARATDFRSSR
jgi:drug/metabolite transporter (DMT)-like permease